MEDPLHRFLPSSDKNSMREHYMRFGMIVVGGFDIDSWFSGFFRDFRRLIDIKLAANKLEATDSCFSDLLRLAEVDRPAVASIHDASQTLPTLFRTMHHELLEEVIQHFGQGPLTVQDLPRVRLDLPNEDQFSDNEHQECFYYDAPEDSINAWFALAPLSKDIGLLRVRPGSHAAGRLLADISETKPRIHIKDGNWKELYPQIEADIGLGDILLFHNSLIHGSGRNRSSDVRCSIQHRYNFAGSEEFESAGWPTTYRVVSRFAIANDVFDQNRKFMKKDNVAGATHDA